MGGEEGTGVGAETVVCVLRLSRGGEEGLEKRNMADTMKKEGGRRGKGERQI